MNATANKRDEMTIHKAIRKRLSEEELDNLSMPLSSLSELKVGLGEKYVQVAREHGDLVRHGEELDRTIAEAQDTISTLSIERSTHHVAVDAKAKERDELQRRLSGVEKALAHRIAAREKDAAGKAAQKLREATYRQPYKEAIEAARESLARTMALWGVTTGASINPDNVRRWPLWVVDVMPQVRGSASHPFSQQLSDSVDESMRLIDEAQGLYDRLYGIESMLEPFVAMSIGGDFVSKARELYEVYRDELHAILFLQ